MHVLGAICTQLAGHDQEQLLYCTVWAEVVAPPWCSLLLLSQLSANFPDTGKSAPKVTRHLRSLGGIPDPLSYGNVRLNPNVLIVLNLRYTSKPCEGRRSAKGSAGFDGTKESC